VDDYASDAQRGLEAILGGSNKKAVWRNSSLVIQPLELLMFE
jgi:hypothetical protein